MEKWVEEAPINKETFHEVVDKHVEVHLRLRCGHIRVITLNPYDDDDHEMLDNIKTKGSLCLTCIKTYQNKLNQ